MTKPRVLEFDWAAGQLERYRRDGFVVVERVIDPGYAQALAARFETVFAGSFETDERPDNLPTLLQGGDRAAVVRWMTNPWRGDHTLAHFALHPGIGRLIADLNGWPGTRLLQNNIHWKPPGAPDLALHQDSSYHLWCVPPDLSTCWVALTDTTAAGGTLMFARGSHRWPPTRIAAYEARIAEKDLKGFLDPRDYLAFVSAAAEHAGEAPEFVPVEVPAGGGAFFNGRVWHGSGANRSQAHRMSISSHGIRPETRFDPDVPANVFERYRGADGAEMDEVGFPVLWRRDGYRTDWLDDWMRRGSAAGLDGQAPAP